MSTRSPATKKRSQRPVAAAAADDLLATTVSSLTSTEVGASGSQLTAQRIISTSVTTSEQMSSAVGFGRKASYAAAAAAAPSGKQSGSSAKVQSTPLAASRERMSFGQQRQTPAGRSPSPVRISRNEEKEEIAHLNTRLATYIDYVRSKETAADSISRKFTSFGEQHEEEIAAVKKLYEREIDGLRKALDSTANERSKLQVDNKKLIAEHDEMSELASRREKEVNVLERRVEMLERELASVRADAGKYGVLRADHNKLLKQFDALKKQLEGEAQLRTQLENKLQTLREDHALKAKVFEEEKLKMSARCTMIETEMSVATEAEFESRLAAELALAREESDKAMAQFQFDMESTFQLKLENVRRLSEKYSSEAVSSRETVMELRARIDATSAELARAQSEAELLRRRNEQLEAAAEQQRADYELQVAHFKEEIQQLHLDIQAKFEEYNDLMLIKIQLDQEILAYRKLLECEEHRLRMETVDLASSPFAGGRSLKRRRMDDAADGSFEESGGGSSSSSAHAHSSSAYRLRKEQCGAVQFADVNVEGRFVRLLNAGDKDVALAGWLLKQSTTSGQELVYKFAARHTTLKAGAHFTLWSAEVDGKHDPAAGEFVMKGQRLAPLTAADGLRTVLLDAKEHEMATCVLRVDHMKSHRSVKSAAASGDKCTVM